MTHFLLYANIVRAPDWHPRSAQVIYRWATTTTGIAQIWTLRLYKLGRLWFKPQLPVRPQEPLRGVLGSIEDPDAKADLIDADLKWRDRLIRELVSLTLAGVNMLLSNEELARLELMFTSGQVHSDPAIISDTDRMMDAMMMRAANMKAKSDINRHGFGQDDQANQQTAREAGTASEVSNLQSLDGKREKASPDSPSEGGLDGDWLPRTLEQLIQIRRSLMRNDDPSL